MSGLVTLPWCLLPGNDLPSYLQHDIFNVVQDSGWPSQHSLKLGKCNQSY